MSFMDAREHGSKPGSGGAASQQNEVCRMQTVEFLPFLAQKTTDSIDFLTRP